MRFDNIGMFWEDIKVVKPTKPPKPKRTPPEPVWLRADYLPNLAEARAASYDLLTPHDLTEMSLYRKPIIFDIEVAPNYFLAGFKAPHSGKHLFLEQGFGKDYDRRLLKWVLQNCLLVGFNSIMYDLPICTLAAAGAGPDWCWWATDQMINMKERPEKVLKALKVNKIVADHIDLIQLTALAPSLKKLAGRLHAPLMMDLPFPPGLELSEDQAAITKWYNGNDLGNTQILFEACTEELDMRVKFGAKYKLDLRSKSDAQIAEAVISNEVRRMKGVQRLDRPDVEVGKQFFYDMPAFIKFSHPALQEVYNDLLTKPFEVALSGNVLLPDFLKRAVEIGGAKYRMGIGGLHSSESNVGYVAGKGYKLIDRDVTSYYPSLILNARMLPRALGAEFIPVYEGIKFERVEAKAKKLVVIDKGLKIVLNGSFGKLLSAYSNLYSPELGIQTTVTGQLSLLMLIEWLVYAGFVVVSANTDGVTIQVPDGREEEYLNIIKHWEKRTGLGTEEIFYKSIWIRDVNNYIAVYEEPQKGERAKVKGIFAGADRQHNPANQIVTDACVAMILDQVPIEQTVNGCSDIRKFVTVREVKGGGVKDGQYLGKIVRFYYSNEAGGEIVYAKTGNKVPNSENCQPAMALPQAFPADVDKERYIKECYNVLHQITYLKEAA